MAAVATVMLSGCGGGSDGPGEDRSAVPGSLELVGFLPPGEQTYSTVDLVALKQGLGLPASADPSRDERLTRFIGTTLNGVYVAAARPAAVRTLDLPSATALASTSGSDGGQITAIATPADPDRIRDALLDLGFIERGGVLEGPDGKRARPARPSAKVEVVQSGEEIGSAESDSRSYRAMAVSVEDGVILVSDSGELLRTIDEARDELPLEVQGSLDGDATLALKLEVGGGCVLEQGIATSADGSGTLIFVVDGEPDPSRFSHVSGLAGFGEPEVDGEQLRIPVDLDEPEPPGDLQAEALPGYDCRS